MKLMHSLFHRARSRSEQKDGFTLVELIVVLVILAILAAIMVPALTGWIRKSRDQDTLITMNTTVKAAKSAYAELYAEKGAVTEFNHMLGTSTGDVGETFMKYLTPYMKGTNTTCDSSAQSPKYSVYIGYYNDRGKDIWSIAFYDVSTYEPMCYYYENGDKVFLSTDTSDSCFDDTFFNVMFGGYGHS